MALCRDANISGSSGNVWQTISKGDLGWKGKVWYIPAATVSYCVGIVISYSLNRYFTFHDRTKNSLKQFTAFTGISVSCLVVNICIVWILVELASANYLMAKLVATGCAFFWNYYGQSRITFKRD